MCAAPITRAATQVSYTTAQASAGAKLFAQNCASCHGAQLQGVSAPGLKGAASGISQQGVGEVYTYISQQMPLTNPGGLRANDYVDIVAFLLRSNGHPGGHAKLSAATAKAATATIRP